MEKTMLKIICLLFFIFICSCITQKSCFENPLEEHGLPLNYTNYQNLIENSGFIQLRLFKDSTYLMYPKIIRGGYNYFSTRGKIEIDSNYTITFHPEKLNKELKLKKLPSEEQQNETKAKILFFDTLTTIPNQLGRVCGLQYSYDLENWKDIPIKEDEFPDDVKSTDSFVLNEEKDSVIFRLVYFESRVNIHTEPIYSPWLAFEKNALNVFKLQGNNFYIYYKNTSKMYGYFSNGKFILIAPEDPLLNLLFFNDDLFSATWER